MRRDNLTLDIAQLEIVNHLTAWKAGVLIKAVVNYWMTGEVAPWGEDADLKPMFLTIRATMEMQREEEEEKQRGVKRYNHAYYLKRKANSRNSSLENLDEESERERERDEEKRSKREEEKEKAKEKEREKEKPSKRNETDETNKQAEMFEPEEAHKKAKAPQFQKPSVADIAEYVKAKGYEQLVDPEEFWHFYESKDWMVGKTKMKKWHSAVVTWVKARKQRQQQRTPHGTSVGERAYNMLHFEYEGHPEMWKEEEKKFAELQKAFR